VRAVNVRVERRDAVVVVTIDRPEVHNAVDGDTAQELEDAVRGFETDETARVLVLTGARGKSFCAGADLKSATSLLTRPGSRESGPMGI
jgi:enoyl-CoA hydratase/carnithine racemase